MFKKMTIRKKKTSSFDSSYIKPWAEHCQIIQHHPMFQCSHRVGILCGSSTYAPMTNHMNSGWINYDNDGN